MTNSVAFFKKKDFTLDFTANSLIFLMCQLRLLYLPISDRKSMKHVVQWLRAAVTQLDAKHD